MKILLIDNYDSFTFNIVELLRQFDSIEFTIVKNDELETCLTDSFDKIIISPGPNLPKASGHLMTFIEHWYNKKPMLGICLGHQALGLFFGATLANFEQPFHGETTKLKHKGENKLFDKLPNTFAVGLYHSWYLSDHSFPSTLNITARSSEDIIMSFEHRTLPIFGVQFHPESYMSAYGFEIIGNFLAS